MAELKLGNIKPVGADNIVVESKYVKGTYVVVADTTARDALKTDDDRTIVDGSLCYVQTESKFYKYSSATSSWEEVQVIVQADSNAVTTDSNSKLTLVGFSTASTANDKEIAYKDKTTGKLVWSTVNSLLDYNTTEFTNSSSLALKLYASGGIEADSTNGIQIKLNSTDSYLELSANGLKVKTGAGGVATLDSQGKVPLSQLPDSILGQLVFGGIFYNDGDVPQVILSSNAISRITSRLGSGESLPSSGNVSCTNTASSTFSSGVMEALGWTYAEGIYFIFSQIQGAGPTSITFGGETYEIGDWLVSTGTSWRKVANTDAVTGVKGSAESAYRTGNVEITAANIGVEAGAEVNVIESVTIGGNAGTVTNKVENFEAETFDPSSKVNTTTTIAGVDLQDNITKSELQTALNVADGAQVNVLEGIQVNGNDLTVDANKKQNISLDDGLTFNTTSKKIKPVVGNGLTIDSTDGIKINSSASDSGKVLAVKADGTVEWTSVGTGDHLFKNDAQAAFETKAEFTTAATSGTFYLANGDPKASSVIAKGDYVIITADEDHNSMQTRYEYNASAGSYASTNWSYVYSLGSAYTGTNGVQVSGTEISIKLNGSSSGLAADSSGLAIALDGTSLEKTSNGLKIRDGWGTNSGDTLVLDGGNASLVEGE